MGEFFSSTVLHQANQSTVLLITKTAQKLLCWRENLRTSTQKKKRKEQIKNKTKTAENNSADTENIQTCKTWGGPCTTYTHSPIELELYIQNQTKLPHICHTHQAERKMEPTLFKIMIPADNKCLENLSVLLGDNNCLATSSHISVLDIPTNV